MKRMNHGGTESQSNTEFYKYSLCLCDFVVKGP